MKKIFEILEWIPLIGILFEIIYLLFYIIILYGGLHDNSDFKPITAKSYEIIIINGLYQGITISLILFLISILYITR